MIKPIETHYKGHRFRSRLEARWAVFFDAIGLKWAYEEQGYERESDHPGKPLRYLPDFRLGDGNLFAEVKGDPLALKKDALAVIWMHDWGGILPGFANSFVATKPYTSGINAGLLLLGEIPWIDNNQTAFFPVIQHDRGLFRSWVTFISDGLTAVVDGSSYGLLQRMCNLESEGIDEDGDGLIVEHRLVKFPCYYPATNCAFKHARSARFEHGQYGAVA